MWLSVYSWVTNVILIVLLSFYCLIIIFHFIIRNKLNIFRLIVSVWFSQDNFRCLAYPHDKVSKVSTQIMVLWCLNIIFLAHYNSIACLPVVLRVDVGRCLPRNAPRPALSAIVIIGGISNFFIFFRCLRGNEPYLNNFVFFYCLIIIFQYIIRKNVYFLGKLLFLDLRRTISCSLWIYICNFYLLVT